MYYIVLLLLVCHSACDVGARSTARRTGSQGAGAGYNDVAAGAKGLSSTARRGPPSTSSNHGPTTTTPRRRPGSSVNQLSPPIKADSKGGPTPTITPTGRSKLPTSSTTEASMVFPDDHRPPVSSPKAAGVDDRNVFQAPEKECPPGQQLDDKGKCRVVV